MIIYLITISATQAQLTEFNVNCPIYNEQHCSPFVATTQRCAVSMNNSVWYASHGSPSIISANNTRYAVLKASAPGGVFTGEGFYSPYSFKAGRQYQLQISIKRVDGDIGGELQIYGANGVVSAGTTSCVEQPLPNVTQKQDIYFIGRARGINSVKTTFNSPVFKPTQDYNQLWVLAKEIFLDNSCEHWIEYITIDDLGPIESPNPPDQSPGPFNFTATSLSHDKVLLKWNDIYNNETDYQYYRVNGTEQRWIRVPAGTTSTIDANLAPNTQYKYRVRASYANGTSSDYSSVRTVTTFAKCVQSVVYTSTPVAFVDRYASNSISLSRSFIMTSGSVTYTAGSVITMANNTHIKNGANFIAKIEPCQENARMASSSVAVSSSETGLYVPDESPIYIYPNPSNGVVTVHLEEKLSTKGKVIILDKFSRQVYSQDVKKGVDEIFVDISSFPHDIYYVKVIDGGRTIQARMIFE